MSKTWSNGMWQLGEDPVTSFQVATKQVMVPKHQRAEVEVKNRRVSTHGGWSWPRSEAQQKSAGSCST